MCGRAYETYTEEELYVRYLNEKSKRNPLKPLKPNFNMSPTQTSPIVLVRDGKSTIELFRWGLVPFWAKDIKSAAKYSLINAKGEEIESKRSYAQAFKARRCIVPLSGFFEWKRPEEGPKIPYAIHLKSHEIMSVAGIWEHWESKDTSEQVNSFSIITISANKFMQKIHDRMPVILDPKDEKKWLDPDNEHIPGLKKLLKPCPASWLEAFEVLPLVNSPRNNRKEVLDPVGWTKTVLSSKSLMCQLTLDRFWEEELGLQTAILLNLCNRRTFSFSCRCRIVSASSYSANIGQWSAYRATSPPFCDKSSTRILSRLGLHSNFCNHYATTPVAFPDISADLVGDRGKANVLIRLILDLTTKRWRWRVQTPNASGTPQPSSKTDKKAGRDFDKSVNRVTLGAKVTF